jgi:sulfonate transport system ATP-binding protein
VLKLSNLSKFYDVSGSKLAALSQIDLEIAAGSFTTIVGRSGCGKTTLLRIMAGLSTHDEGSLSYDAEKRSVGVVFQEPRLMPWLDVSGNIAFGLRKTHSKEAIQKKIDDILAVTGLSDFRHAMPSQLSGGMAQRVALARALVMEPQLLLMDEPFAALDAFTRRSMQNELISLWQRQQTTIVFVTHDVEEAVLLGQTVVELSQGKIVGRTSIDIPYPRDPTCSAEALCRRSILSRLLLPCSHEPLKTQKM